MWPSSEAARTQVAFLLLIFLILEGVGFRFWNFTEMPFGLDSDQARVLSWGHSMIDQGEFRAFASKSTDFEALSSYFFASFERIGVSARVGSQALLLLDLLLLWLLLGEMRVRTIPRLVGVALLATSPFAFYYSRVVGPCVGVSTVLLFYLWISRRFGFASIAARTAGILTVATGLLYYSMFRLLPLFEILRSAWSRERGRMIVAGSGVVVALGLVAGAGEGAVSGLFRGSYNFALHPMEIGKRVIEGLQLWWGPPSARWVHPQPELIVDPVSQGFAWALAGAPALGWGFALMFAGAVFGAIRGFIKKKERPGPESAFMLFTLVALMLSPTPSHAVFILPLVAMFVAERAGIWSQGSSWRETVVATVAALACVAGLAQTTGLQNRLGERGSFDAVFSDRLRQLFETRINLETQAPVLYFTPQQLETAGYWALQGPARVLPGIEPALALETARGLSRGSGSVVVYFDIQEIDFSWKSLPAAWKQFDLVREIERQIRQTAEVLSVEEIEIEGQKVARRFELRWN